MTDDFRRFLRARWTTAREEDLMRRVAKIRAAHPVETCGLFRTKTGRCTCPEQDDAP